MDSRLSWVVKKKVGPAEEDERGKEPKSERCLKEIFDGSPAWVYKNSIGETSPIEDFQFHKFLG